MTTDPGRSSSRWWLAPLIGLIVLFTAGAGLAARSIYHQSSTTTATSSGTSSAPPTSTSVPPGSTQVQLSADVTQYPLGNTVRQLLQTYFDATNDKNYQQWTSVATEARIVQTPRTTWLSGLKTTHDSDITVYRIDVAPQNGLRVLLAFTSTQDIKDAPDYAPYKCINWSVVWPLSLENNQWKLDAGSAGKTPAFSACPS
ncbi:MAG TPA: hypothetical protein VG756_11845 [Pseudonocardiaceae bacterium]|nr:hypothetical protein [Pseudonocardiaceae bacterium]